MRGALLEITKKHMESCDWVAQNLIKYYKRFEDLELGGDLQGRGIPGVKKSFTCFTSVIIFRRVIYCYIYNRVQMLLEPELKIK